MLELCALVGASLVLVALPGLAYPALVGWKRRRDAGIVLLLAAGLLSIVFLA